MDANAGLVRLIQKPHFFPIFAKLKRIDAPGSNGSAQKKDVYNDMGWTTPTPAFIEAYDPGMPGKIGGRPGIHSPHNCPIFSSPTFSIVKSRSSVGLP
jgi:hypothetical protein